MHVFDILLTICGCRDLAPPYTFTQEFFLFLLLLIQRDSIFEPLKDHDTLIVLRHAPTEVDLLELRPFFDFITLITTDTILKSASSQTVKLTRIRLKAVHERTKCINRRWQPVGWTVAILFSTVIRFVGLGVLEWPDFLHFRLYLCHPLLKISLHFLVLLVSCFKIKAVSCDI